MKQALMTTGEVELTKEELDQALLSYANRHLKQIKAIMVEATRDYLKEKYDLETTKTIFIEKDDAVQGLVAQVKREIADTVAKFSSQPVIVNKGKITSAPRPNVGIFPFIKEQIVKAKRNKDKTMSYDDLAKLVFKKFPKMDDKRLKLYLYDTEQLPGVKFEAKQRLIYI